MQDRGTFVIAGVDCAIFDGDWKLIETNDGKRSLYNIAKDPSETTDLLAKEAALSQRLETELARVKKELPTVRIRQRPGPGGPGPGNRGRP